MASSPISFRKGDIAWIKEDPESIKYANRWFDGYRGPYRIDRTARESSWMVYVSKPDGTFWDNDYAYSTIIQEYLRPDTFMNAVREAVKDAT